MRRKIVPNAHRINSGQVPDIDNKSNDFFFEERQTSGEICATTVSLVTKRLPKYLNVSAREIQVLCKTHGKLHNLRIYTFYNADISVKNASPALHLEAHNLIEQEISSGAYDFQ